MIMWEHLRALVSNTEIWSQKLLFPLFRALGEREHTLYQRLPRFYTATNHFGPNPRQLLPR